MATAEQVVSLARSQVGETSGSKYWASVFPSWAFVSGSKTPWCACFVSWVFAQAGQRFPGLPSGYCPAILNACNASRIVLASNRAASWGDVVFFDWDGGMVDHIGIVIENLGDSGLVTVEGNTLGSRVAIRTRAWGTVAAVARPSYDGKSWATHILVDGLWGSDTTRLAQQAVSTPVDGVVSSQGVWWQKNDTLAACTTGWEFVESPRGSQLIAALQKIWGCDPDGLMGPATVNAMEKHYGFYPDNRLDYPSATVAAFQAALNRGTI